MTENLSDAEIELLQEAANSVPSLLPLEAEKIGRALAELREWREWGCWACGHGEHEPDICPRCEWICIHGERQKHKVNR